MDKDIVLMKEGRWSLVEEEGIRKWNLHSSILHYCDGHSVNLNSIGYYTHYIIKRWPADVSDPPAWRCIGCGSTPPESLLTVFILHNWEDCSNEIMMPYLLAK